MSHYRLHNDPRSSHRQIARIVRELDCGKGPVLDVGAAQGIIGRLLQDGDLEVDAVEPNSAWAEAARPFYRKVFPCLIEQANLPDSHYRVIVCGDVLEHTADPVGVLRQLHRHATNNAVYIISLPNVAHLSARLMLLFGRFPKMDRGILDRTHLHFFTRDTASEMLVQAGLSIIAISATPVPLDTYFSRPWTRWIVTLAMKMQHAAVALLPRLFGMQWVFVARRQSEPSAI
jgi:2-polyprenyl-3-methyl-5-hydroxy-6-metoxy-1,4-benzoquinol methylase